MAADDAAMSRSGRQHQPVEAAGLALPMMPPPKRDGDLAAVPSAPLKRGGENFEASMRNPAVEHRLDLRRDAEAVNVPERARMSQESGTLRLAQGMPDVRTLLAERIEDRLPGEALPGGAHQSLADTREESGDAAGGVGAKIAAWLDLDCRMSPRAPAVSRESDDAATMSSPIQRGDGVGHRKPGADDQNALVPADRGKAFCVVGICFKPGMRGDGEKRRR